MESPRGDGQISSKNSGVLLFNAGLCVRLVLVLCCRVLSKPEVSVGACYMTAFRKGVL